MFPWGRGCVAARSRVPSSALPTQPRLTPGCHGLNPPQHARPSCPPLPCTSPPSPPSAAAPSPSARSHEGRRRRPPSFGPRSAATPVGANRCPPLACLVGVCVPSMAPPAGAGAAPGLPPLRETSPPLLPADGPHLAPCWEWDPPPPPQTDSFPSLCPSDPSALPFGTVHAFDFNLPRVYLRLGLDEGTPATLVKDLRTGIGYEGAYLMAMKVYFPSRHTECFRQTFPTFLPGH